MFKLLKPTPEEIERFLAAQQGLSLTYATEGATRTLPGVLPPECSHGYHVDHNRVQLGYGPEAFERARIAIVEWRMFDLDWVSIAPPRPVIDVGTVVAILVRPFGIWSINASRIVYVVDEDGPISRFGFAYGTLPEHVESGEERFTVEWRKHDDSVWYDLLAFSRPKHPLVRIGRTYARAQQQRFIADSLNAMNKDVRSR